MSTNAEKAAKWWREKIEGGAKGDAALDGMAALMASMRPTGTNTPEALDAFEASLAAEIQKQIDMGRTHVNIDVDYHPCALLANAAQASGLKVPAMGWPFKTRCEVKPDGVDVCNGYGQGYRSLD